MRKRYCIDAGMICMFGSNTDEEKRVLEAILAYNGELVMKLKLDVRACSREKRIAPQ